MRSLSGSQAQCLLTARSHERMQRQDDSFVSRVVHSAWELPLAWSSFLIIGLHDHLRMSAKGGLS